MRSIFFKSTCFGAIRAIHGFSHSNLISYTMTQSGSSPHCRLSLTKLSSTGPKHHFRLHYVLHPENQPLPSDRHFRVPHCRLKHPPVHQSPKCQVSQSQTPVTLLLILTGHMYILWRLYWRGCYTLTAHIMLAYTINTSVCYLYFLTVCVQKKFPSGK